MTDKKKKKKKDLFLLPCLPASSSCAFLFLGSDDMLNMYCESFNIAQSSLAMGHMAILEQCHAA